MLIYVRESPDKTDQGTLGFNRAIEKAEDIVKKNFKALEARDKKEGHHCVRYSYFDSETMQVWEFFRGPNGYFEAKYDVIKQEGSV